MKHSLLNDNIEQFCLHKMLQRAQNQLSINVEIQLFFAKSAIIKFEGSLITDRRNYYISE